MSEVKVVIVETDEDDSRLVGVFTGYKAALTGIFKDVEEGLRDLGYVTVNQTNRMKRLLREPERIRLSFEGREDNFPSFYTIHTETIQGEKA